MSLIVNGTEIDEVVYNGTYLDEMLYNGEIVFFAGSYLQHFEVNDSNMTSFEINNI